MSLTSFLKWLLSLIEDKPWTPYPPISGLERPSPKGRIALSNVRLDSEKVVITEPSLKHYILTNTNSMDGWMDEGHIVLVKALPDYKGLVRGDIIVFSTDIGKIVHRIEQIDSDALGRIYRTQGINNDRPDPYTVRNGNIVGVVVGWVATTVLDNS